MIWLTWQQHRKQAWFTLAAFAVLAVVMFPIGLAMQHAFSTSGIPACLGKAGTARVISSAIDPHACEDLADQFNGRYQVASLIAVLFMVVPALVGLFWGAPLVAGEIEHGTHRLVWTQSISRRRWALVKFGLIGGFTLAIAAGYAVGLSWWLGPWSRSIGSGRFSSGVFDVMYLVPVGYTLFAVALGIFAGTVWHKVLPAMAVTLVGFLVLRIAVLLARPHFLPARTISVPVRSAVQLNRSVGDWILSFGVRNAAGVLIGPNKVARTCVPGTGGCPAAGAPGGSGGSGGSGNNILAEFNWEKYQPANRFWLFQGIETGIFVALAVLLIFLAVRRIRRIA
jgi:hypothetical protein